MAEINSRGIGQTSAMVLIEFPMQIYMVSQDRSKCLLSFSSSLAPEKCCFQLNCYTEAVFRELTKRQQSKSDLRASHLDLDTFGH